MPVTTDQLTIQQVIDNKLWIVYESNRKVGTLRSITDGYEFFDQRDKSSNIVTDIDQFKLITSNKEELDKVGTIKGYSTESSKPVISEHHILPAFTKTKSSKTIFVAGFYLINFDGVGWQTAHAPKLATIEKYSFEGPFLTEWEVNIELKKAKRDRR
jgi:hypothetical protein